MMIMIKYPDGKIDVVNEHTAKMLMKQKKAVFVKFVKDNLDVVTK
jgi:hypothetical protein